MSGHLFPRAWLAPRFAFALLLPLVAGGAPKARGDGGTPRLERLAAARQVDIEAARLEVFGRERRAVYSGNARARRDDTLIRCDRITVHYSPRKEVTQVLAEGNVEVEDGQRWARGERAEFDNLTGVLVVKGDPEARQGGTHVRGSQVTFTAGADTVEVLDASTVMASGPDGGLPATQIDAERLVIAHQDRQAVWTGKVRARRGTTDLRTRRLVAHYAESNELTRLQASGGVEVLDQDRWASGERADYDHARRVLVVTGNPRARQGTSRLAGTRVTFFLGTDRLVVENARTELDPRSAPGRKGGGR